ncbi:nodulation efficiency protein D [Fervidicella metallireducens AeB]|uniref:Nodulation efficiency protein D n=1 Tax=Fervidicella metallireducens AeB TaxID=1403537 RepID=A0A017RVY0_9CLOT|nr:NfeD family protein [Fervidicella metallireducens]EYE88040.1 nodulation efficiency protein D [Fervidicella metallireducens AeB]
MNYIILWFLIALTAFVIDVLTSSFFFAGFTVGGISAIVAYMFDAPFLTQLIVFGVVSILAITAEYKWFREKMKKSIPKTLRMEEGYVGRKIIVDEDIQERGRIKIDGIYWTAVNQGQPIKKGARAEIIDIIGNKVVIKRLEEDK